MDLVDGIGIEGEQSRLLPGVLDDVFGYPMVQHVLEDNHKFATVDGALFVDHIQLSRHLTHLSFHGPKYPYIHRLHDVRSVGWQAQ